MLRRIFFPKQRFCTKMMRYKYDFQYQYELIISTGYIQCWRIQLQYLGYNKNCQTVCRWCDREVARIPKTPETVFNQVKHTRSG